MRLSAKPAFGAGILATSIYGIRELGEEVTDVVVGAGVGDGAGAGLTVNLDLRVSNAVPAPLNPLSSPRHAATAKISTMPNAKRVFLISNEPLTQAIRDLPSTAAVNFMKPNVVNL